MKRLVTFALVASLVVMASGTAQAQQQRQRGGVGFGGGGQLMYLGQKSVQEELKLSEEQVKKITELAAKQREALQGLADLSQEERRTKIQEQAQATNKAIGEILDAKQQKRIKEISLQQQGARAINNAEVAKSLNLTDEQKEKVQTILRESRPAGGAGFQRGQQIDEETRKKMEEARKATNDKLMSVLTDEQKTKLKEMTGEPFKGEIRRPGFGGGNRDR